MKRYVLLLCCTIMYIIGFAQSLEYNSKSGKWESKSHSSTWVITSEVVTKNGADYPIYINSNGRCAIRKVSGPNSKTPGKEYWAYLSEEDSKQICQKLGRQYKPKKKQ